MNSKSTANCNSPKIFLTRVSLYKTKRITPLVTLSVLGYDTPVCSVTPLQGGPEIYSPLGVM